LSVVTTRLESILLTVTKRSRALAFCRFVFPKNAMRYYREKYPEVDELVMVQVRQIAEMGAYVKLVSVV
jgi:hypothetical protein